MTMSGIGLRSGSLGGGFAFCACCDQGADGSWIFVGWGVGSDEFGACVKEELFKGSQGIGAAGGLDTTIKKYDMITLPSTSHFCVLFAITFFRDVRNVVIQSARRKSMAHCEQSVHPICCLADLE